jgi:carbonic anhydrase
MRKLLHLDSPTGQYQCDAAVVACFDNRFDAALRKLLKRLGIERPDTIRIAGGAKALASPEPASERDVVVDQVGKSVNLHRTTRALLVLHSDCGAYGGIERRFESSRDAEVACYEEEFRKAAAVLAESFPGIEVGCYYIDFTGVWEVRPFK